MYEQDYLSVYLNSLGKSDLLRLESNIKPIELLLQGKLSLSLVESSLCVDKHEGHRTEEDKKRFLHFWSPLGTLYGENKLRYMREKTLKQHISAAGINLLTGNLFGSSILNILNSIEENFCVL